MDTNLSMFSIHQDQGLVEGDKVMIIDPNTDIDWMSDEEAGNIEVDLSDRQEQQVRRMLAKWAAKKLEKANKGDLDASDDQDVYKARETSRMDEIEETQATEEFWRFCRYVEYQGHFLRKALSVRGKLETPSKRKGIKKETSKKTVKEAWLPVNRFNAQKGGAIRQHAKFLRESFMRDPQGNVLSSSIYIEDKEHAFRLLKADLALQQYLGMTEIWRQANLGLLIWRAQKITKQVTDKKHGKAAPYWDLYRKVKKLKEEFASSENWSARYNLYGWEMNPFWTNGIAEECDDPRPDASFPNPVINQAWAHVNEQRAYSQDSEGQWFGYDRGYVGRLIEENRKMSTRQYICRNLFYQLLRRCSKKKVKFNGITLDINEHRARLDELAQGGLVYWWLNPQWLQDEQERYSKRCKLQKKLDELKVTRDTYRERVAKGREVVKTQPQHGAHLLGLEDALAAWEKTCSGYRQEIFRLKVNGPRPAYKLKGKEWVDTRPKPKTKKEKKKEAQQVDHNLVDLTQQFNKDFQQMMQSYNDARC